MPSMAEKHCGREKQTKSDQKEVISGNMSQTRKNIKDIRGVIYNKKAFHELTHALQGRI